MSNFNRYLFPFLFGWLLIGCGYFGTDHKAKNWELFRGDVAMSGYTDSRLPEKPVLLWNYKSEARTASSPIVSNGTVYWVDKRGVVRGLDEDGKQVFSYDFETAVEATPMICDSVLYIGQMNGRMCALSIPKRDTLWSFETMGQVSAAPNWIEVDGRKTIVFGSYDNYLYLVDAQTGKEKSRFESGYYINGAVAQWGNITTFGGCDGWLRVVDVVRGAVTDSMSVETYIPASPAIVDGHVYVADYSGNVYDVELKGDKIAKYEVILKSQNKKSSFVSVPACSEQAVYILSDDANLYAIDRKNGNLLWKTLLGGDTGESSPVVARDKILVCTKSGLICKIDATNGNIEWEYDTGEQITASPAVIDGRFYILTSKGTLFCFGADK